VQNRNIYTVKEGKSKNTKIRGLKGTSEDISISRRKQSQKVQGSNRGKRYKETPVKLYTGEKPQSKVYTGREKPQSKFTKETSVFKSKGTKRKAG
jgi:hypothetical protein